MDEPTPPTLEEVRAAKPAAFKAFSALGEVVGVGITRIGPNYALRVNLAAPLPSDCPWPRTIEGVPVDLKVVGTIRKLSEQLTKVAPPT